MFLEIQNQVFSSEAELLKLEEKATVLIEEYNKLKKQAYTIENEINNVNALINVEKGNLTRICRDKLAFFIKENFLDKWFFDNNYESKRFIKLKKVHTHVKHQLGLVYDVVNIGNSNYVKEECNYIYVPVTDERALPIANWKLLEKIPEQVMTFYILARNLNSSDLET